MRSKKSSSEAAELIMQLVAKAVSATSGKFFIGHK